MTKRKDEELLMELAKLDTLSHIRLNTMNDLMQATDEAIQAAEDAMFNLHANSQERVALRIHELLMSLKSAKQFVESSVTHTTRVIQRVEAQADLIIHFELEIDDESFNQAIEELRTAIQLIQSDGDAVQEQIANVKSIAAQFEIIGMGQSLLNIE